MILSLHCKMLKKEVFFSNFSWILSIFTESKSILALQSNAFLLPQ